jgi:hypothetical protein
MKTFNEYKSTDFTQKLTSNVDQILAEAKEAIEKQVQAEKIDEVVTAKNENPVQENYQALTPAEKVEETFPGYIIHRDKTENFVCDLQLTGVNSIDNKARIILETEDLTYMFEGRIDTLGKCKIPLRKMSFLKENETGKIKLEVIAEDTIFTPWEDEFVAVTSKKVSVKVMESETSSPKMQVKVTNIGNR